MPIGSTPTPDPNRRIKPGTSKWGHLDAGERRGSLIHSQEVADVRSQRPLIFFLHLQKTGGWSVLEYALRVAKVSSPSTSTLKFYYTSRSRIHHQSFM